MPDTAKTSGRNRKVPWEAIGGITAVASVVVAVVFGIAELTKSDDQPPAAPADERLELVDVEFADKPVDVAVLEEVRTGERPKVTPKPGKSGIGVQQHRPLVITLRNPADDPAVLTGVKVVVYEVVPATVCGAGRGGAVSASLNYDFRFPTPLDGQWSTTNTQNFTVEPHSVNALSLTLGPELADDTSVAWRFSVFGVSKGGVLAHWGDGVGTNHPVAAAAGYETYVWGDFPKPGYTEQGVRDCAAQALQRFEKLTGGIQGSELVHPAYTGLVDAYRRVAKG